MTGYLVLVPIGYLLGSLPFGLIAGRLFGRIDVRDHGSGSTGMTNVLRTTGVPAAALVLILDMGKAVVAVALAKVFTDSPGVEAATALSSMVGHNWPIFSGFRGGKGTAAGWGAMIILSPLSGLAATVAGFSAAAVSRYVSLGSMIGSAGGSGVLVALALLGIEPMPYIWFGLFSTVLVVVRHKENISRLASGQERKLGQRTGGLEGRVKAPRGKGLRWPRSA